MAEIGVRNLDDLVGRSDLLEVDQSVLHYKNKGRSSRYPSYKYQSSHEKTSGQCIRSIHPLNMPEVDHRCSLQKQR